MKRNFKLKDRTLLNADIISPEVPYAQFSEEIAKEDVQKIVFDLNCGSQMLDIYSKYRGNLHIVSVIDMLKEMEILFGDYKYLEYKLKKKGFNND